MKKRLLNGALPTEMVRAAGELTEIGADQAQVVWSACSSLSHGDVYGTLSILEREVVRTEDSTALTRLSSDPKVLYWATDRTVTMLEQAFHLFEQRRKSHLEQ